MKIQSLESLNLYIKGVIRRNNKVRLSTLFRYSRKRDSVSMIADSPLIYYLVISLEQFSCRTITRRELLRTINYSTELSQLNKSSKTLLIEAMLLSKVSNTGLKLTKNHPKLYKKKK